MNVPKICHERLDSWKEQLIRRNMTPVVTIGVGHGQTNGQMLVLAPEGQPTNAELIGMLEFAIRQLKEGA
jgi:hypothetical protein